MCGAYIEVEARHFPIDSTLQAPVENTRMIEKSVENPLDSASSIYVWRVNPITEDRVFTHRDTIRYNFQQTSLQDGRLPAVGHLGNVGAPSYSKLYFENASDGIRFYPLATIYPYLQTAETNLFYNTKMPYSNIYYQTGGAKANKEERLKGLITTNLGKTTNLGFNIDYIYSRGYYQYLSNKSLGYNLFASYIKDRYQMHVWAGNTTMTFSENGGLVNDLFVINPDSPDLPSTTYTASDFPVRMSNTWNRVKAKQIFFTNSYDIGYHKETKTDIEQKADSSFREFVPVAKVFFSSNLQKVSRRFSSADSAFVSGSTTRRVLDTLYTDVYYTRPVNDYSALTQWDNTVGISMREGFRPWVKFGLSAYMTNVHQVYTVPDSVAGVFHKENRNTTFIGGVLNKRQGQHLRYDLRGRVAVLGTDIGELKLEGNVTSMFELGKKPLSISAMAYIYNTKPNYSISRVYSKYFRWDENFGDTRKVFLGGRVEIPHTKTVLSVGVENIQNIIYFNEEKKAVQNGGSVQVFSARLDQNFRLGIFNWNNQIVFQTTTDETSIPLPAVSIYSNLFLQTKLAKVLTIQAGIDAHYHTDYKAPGYEPALMTFYNQRSTTVGGFPLSTVYVNAHLKKTRFFVMYYNVFQNAGNNGYFTVPHYPVNPTIFKWGLSWDFNN